MLPVSRAGAAPDSRPARLLMALLLLAVIAFVVSTIPGVRAATGFETVGFDPLLDGWLQGGGYVIAAALALLRPFASRVDRAIWAWLAAAVTVRALGFVLFLAFVRRQQPPPFPSVADAAWLAMYVLMLAGLVELARRRTRRVSVPLVLDAAVGVLAAAALAVALLYPSVLSLTAPGTPSGAVAVNLAYPVLDLMLLVAFVGVLLAYEWHPPPAAWVLAAGVVGFAVIDGVFVYQSASGTFRPGTWLSSVSLAVMALVAVAGWLPGGPRAGRREPLPNVVLPVIFALVCLGLLVFATQTRVPTAGVVLAGAGVAVAIARTGLSFRAVRSLAEHRREARTDELTGLANRRSFNETLEQGAGPPPGRSPPGAADRGPRRLQGGERLPRPPLRRRAAPAGGPPHPAGGPRWRCGRPHRWRRVRRPARRRRRTARRQGRRTVARRLPAPVPPGVPARRDRAERGHRPRARRCARTGRAAPARRPRDVRGQGRP